MAFPVRGQQLLKADPVGWVLFDTMAGYLPVFHDGKIINKVKVKTLAGSRAGLIGVLGDGTGITYKVEGPSDVLSLVSQGLAPGETVVCNVGGCGEKPHKTPWLSDFFKGRDVVVLGDNDEPGQAGAQTWARFAAGTAESCRLVRLPGPIAKTGGRVLRFWQDSWWKWKDGAYVELTDKYLASCVTGFIDEEFRRINKNELADFYERQQAGLVDADASPPVCPDRSGQLTSAVIQSMSSMVSLSPSVKLNSWVPDRERRNYISVKNGLLDMDALLANKEREEVLFSHSPDWFSTVHFPYDYDPRAECPQWQEFLELSLENDHERINVLQEWAGYLLLPHTNEQRFMILEGEGANGKSVFCAGMEAMLGSENCSHLAFERFGADFGLHETLGKLVSVGKRYFSVKQGAKATPEPIKIA
ncbi:MAG: hypothetical protein ACOC7K_00665 [bacterium]